MSHTLGKDVPARPPRSISMGGAIKEGFLFPFMMDKEKARVFGLHMLFMVLGVTGYLTIDVPYTGNFFSFAAGQACPYLCAILCFGTLMLSYLYTLQRVVMGRPTHSYLRLAFSACFGKFIIYFMIYFIFSGVLACIPLGIIADCYVMSRLAMILPDVAAREGAMMGDGWRMARGYVFEIFCVRLVIGFSLIIQLFFSFILTCAFYILMRIMFQWTSFDFSKVFAEGISFEKNLWAGIFIGLFSWAMISLPAALGRLYKDIREDRAAEGAACPVETALAADEIINTTPTGVNP